MKENQISSQRGSIHSAFREIIVQFYGARNHFLFVAPVEILSTTSTPVDEYFDDFNGRYYVTSHSLFFRDQTVV